ncbi:unnamed protein product [Ostreobium quekettii]|uniref:Bacterial surface antigen (D15) domain-containing protein n=1 Tax=Ostreobium quekettii TaxID=121088 RepID=A0A8S1IQK6_9CHLO|nr:unnamed protein product [Ostreobium quekettii]
MDGERFPDGAEADPDAQGDAPPPPPDRAADGSPGPQPAADPPAGGGGEGRDGPKDVSELFDLVKDRPCRVTEIEGRGFKRTRPLLVTREMERVREARTLEEIQGHLAECMAALEDLDLFASVEGELLEGDKDSPDTCRLVMEFEEKPPWKMHVGTYVQGHEGSVEATVGLRNLLGNAEHAQLSLDYSSQKSSEYAFQLWKPRLVGLPWKGEVKLFNWLRSNQQYSSFVERIRGVSFGLKCSGGLHSFTYDLAWRLLSDPSRLASPAICEQLGHSLKSSLAYDFNWDKRESSGRPKSGRAFRMRTELGGLAPDSIVAKYIREQVDLQWTLPLFSTVSFTLGLSAGMLLPVGQDFLHRKTAVGDRFFLGGVGSLRGFEARGVGPTDARRRRTEQPSHDADHVGAQARDALGGDLLCSASAAVNFDLPHSSLQWLGVYGHAFFNAGNTMLLCCSGRPLRSSLQEFGASFRSSAGAGLVFPTVFGTFELNYVVPLTFSNFDRVKHGMQMGFASTPFLNM